MPERYGLLAGVAGIFRQSDAVGKAMKPDDRETCRITASEEAELEVGSEESTGGASFCATKVQLVAEYSAAVAAYYSAIGELEQGMVTGSREVYAFQRRASDEARALCEAARQQLDEHIAEHQC